MVRPRLPNHHGSSFSRGPADDTARDKAFSACRSQAGARLHRRQAPAVQFFRGDPFSLATYQARIAELRTLRTQRARGCGRGPAPLVAPCGRAACAVRRKGWSGCHHWTADGLFTGPLYTVHKILGAITLADVLEKALEMIVLPVFGQPPRTTTGPRSIKRG